jgi:flavin-dependent dehydrogenase
MPDICVIGAGPAGSVLAARLAQLGYQVHLVERERFPRRHLGESLSPGVMPLLASARLHDAIQAAAFPRVTGVWVTWAGEPKLREDAREQGTLVDRGEFDLRLLERTRELGVRVYQPARVIEQFWDGVRWRLQIKSDTDQTDLSVDFVADAAGRRQTRQPTSASPSTLALYGYWRGKSLPSIPRIEAGRDAWYWGVPLPDGTYNTLVFVDPEAFRSMPGVTLAERFLTLIGASELMENGGDAELIAPARAIDATPYLSNACVATNRIQVGDAGMTIDPISSSGVQKAIQTALSGAIVVNTLLRRPESAEAAMSFYRAQLGDSFERHRRWATQHYRDVANQRDHPFWSKRAASVAPPDTTPVPPVDARALITVPVALSRELEFVATPCLRGDFVSIAEALHHPRLAGPVVFLGGRELAPLVRGLPPGRTPLQIAHSWSRWMPLTTGMAITGWLVNHGILVEQNAGGTVA